MEKELIIRNPESGNSYLLKLNEEDYNKALTDDQFASSLLYHAVSNEECEELGEQHKELNEQHEEPQTELNKKDGQPSYIKRQVCTNWNYQQTICLINSMSGHYSDFNDPRKRKNIFENICNDLISAGFSVNSIQVQNKWKSLVRSYNRANDAKQRTGEGPCRFLFFDLLYEILGQKPTNKCSHSINSIEINDDAASSTNTENAVPEIVQKENEENSRKKRKMKVPASEFAEIRSEEYKKKQIRHEEKMHIEREKIEIEKQKIRILEKYIALRSKD